MIALAEAAERADPIGCRYVCQDAAQYEPAEPRAASWEDFMAQRPLVAFVAIRR